MDEAKQVSQRIYDEVHCCLDFALLAAADVPDVLGEGVDEDNILWHDEAYSDEAEEVQLETPLDVEERVQGGRGQALDWRRGGGAFGGLYSVEHEGVIILPLNPLIAIALSWILCSFHVASINLSRY